MKRYLLLGLLLGALHSAFSLYSMINPIPYPVWDALNNVAFIMSVGVLLGLVIISTRGAGSLTRTITNAAIYSAAYLVIQLAAYAITTRFFADRLVQLPFFFKDYTYHAYVSPAEYLATHYADLLGLQAFSTLVVFIFQITLSGLVAVAVREIRERSRQTPAIEQG